ncbi:MAG TPA: right-handed parallel beta-helix repeat-containing protein, partial [Candidatus Binatia bacterium]|nr:right-handed parallel beta-helix repeat-containing protein [Candidatus Binatia bacterium]
MRRTITATLCIAGTLLVGGGTAHATEHFVEAGQSGTGSSSSPFGSIAAAMAVAQPGDTISVRAGTYNEAVITQRAGTATLPITLRAVPGAGPVLVTAFGRAVQILHPNIVLEGLVLDGQYGDRSVLDVDVGPFTIRNSEIRRSSRDCVELANSQSVTIGGCRIHHCLNWTAGRVDAHGITGSQVQDLVVQNTEIYAFTGDAIQFDPARACPGWDNILIQGCNFWLAPLPSSENGVPAGEVPGENAIDTKVCPPSQNPSRHHITVTDTTARGFMGQITNMAAFNMKEHVDAVFDGVTVFDSEIAFRLRGPG